MFEAYVVNVTTSLAITKKWLLSEAGRDGIGGETGGGKNGGNGDVSGKEGGGRGRASRRLNFRGAPPSLGTDKDIAINSRALNSWKLSWARNWAKVPDLVS